MYKEIKQKAEEKNKTKKTKQKKHLTTCQSASKSLYSSSTHPPLLAHMSSNSWDALATERVHKSDCPIAGPPSLPLPSFPKLNPPSMANSGAGMVSICSTPSMAVLSCRLYGHLFLPFYNLLRIRHLLLHNLHGLHHGLRHGLRHGNLHGL